MATTVMAPAPVPTLNVCVRLPAVHALKSIVVSVSLEAHAPDCALAVGTTAEQRSVASSAAASERARGTRKRWEPDVLERLSHTKFNIAPTVLISCCT